LQHVNLMSRVERGSAVKFTSEQMAGLKNVGELIDLLAAKLSK